MHGVEVGSMSEMLELYGSEDVFRTEPKWRWFRKSNNLVEHSTLVAFIEEQSAFALAAEQPASAMFNVEQLASTALVANRLVLANGVDLVQPAFGSRDGSRRFQQQIAFALAAEQPASAMFNVEQLASTALVANRLVLANGVGLVQPAFGSRDGSGRFQQQINHSNR
jgi:ParB-like chromosome segregation protein Spo0J